MYKIIKHNFLRHVLSLGTLYSNENPQTGLDRNEIQFL